MSFKLKVDTLSPQFRAAKLAAILARQYPGMDETAVAVLVSKMQKAARIAKKWELKCCNDTLDEAAQDSGQNRLQKLQDQINGTLSTGSVKISLGGDPRGPCASMIVSGQRGDGWGDGYAIY